MKSNYDFSNLQEINNELLKEGVYVVLLNVFASPPHLLLYVSGRVFSINTLGPKLDEQVEKYDRYIRKNNVPSIFVKLELPQVFTNEHLLDKIRSITSSYPRVDIGVATCLNPIKDFCGEILSVEKSQIHLVFDLLDELKQKKAIQGYYHLNLESALENGSLSLQKYSIFDVNEAIHGVAVH